MRLCVKCKTQGVFGTDRLTGFGYCKSHQYLRTDTDKRTPLQKAIEKAKLQTHVVTKELRFQSPKKIHKGTFDESVLNSEIKFIPPTPECYEGKETGRYIMDEVGVTGACGIDESLVNLSADLDMVMSLYIRHKYADKNGMVKCFCCPKVLAIKEIHNGHYCKRGHKATRFMEENMRPQCPECNQDHNYDETAYTNALEAEHEGITVRLKERAQLVYKATRSELKELLIEYRHKFELVKKTIKP